MPDLIITNGDSAADLLAAAGKTGRILPWRDVLHEGPIVGGSLPACSGRRVPFLARRFGLDSGEVAADFAARDAIMGAHRGFDRIELWFEHDLYDQLQLLQILSFFADQDRSDGLMLVQADDFLGSQRPETILRFGERARAVTGDDLDFADRIWADLAMPTPEAVVRGLAEPDSPLPFVEPALRRFLEELPAPRSGLGRSEAFALAGLGEGRTRAGELFQALLASEEAPFMGDWSFFRLLDDLAFAAAPLIAGLAPPDREPDVKRYLAAALSLTPTGEAVLRGEADHVALNGLGRWWAGTPLMGRSVWRYDRGEMMLVPPEASGP